MERPVDGLLVQVLGDWVVEKPDPEAERGQNDEEGEVREIEFWGRLRFRLVQGIPREPWVREIRGKVYPNAKNIS